MPIPLLLAGLGITAAVLGVAGHADAKETNEKAEKIVREAEELHKEAMRSLDIAREKTEQSLLSLGNLKKETLDTSIKQFMIVYERIKHVDLRESTGIYEVKNLLLDHTDVLELREMSDIYGDAFSSSVAGATTGAAIALAASGSLPIIAGTLSTAGTALMAGNVSAAAGLTGSALSFGATATPLAAILGPALFISAISSSIKADGNLEKAQALMAKAEVEIEKMKVSELLCNGISERGIMFEQLLIRLNQMLAPCVAQLDGVTRKKMGIFGNKKIEASELTQEEKKLIAVTGALVKAVKSVVDTPILTSEGQLSSESEEVYENTKKEIPNLLKDVQEVTSHYKNKNIKSKSSGLNSEDWDYLRNLFALFAGYIMMRFVQEHFNNSFFASTLAYSFATLLFLNRKTKMKGFVWIKIGCQIALGISLAVMLFTYGDDVLQTKHYIMWCIASIVGAVIYFTLASGRAESNVFLICLSFIGITVFITAIAILFLALVHNFLGLPYNWVAYPVVIIYGILICAVAIALYN